MCFFSPSGVSFPSPLKEENLLNVPKPLPKQLWETKEVGGKHLAVSVVTEYLHFRGHLQTLQRREQGTRGKAEQMSGDGNKKNLLGNDGPNENDHSCVETLVQGSLVFLVFT